MQNHVNKFVHKRVQQRSKLFGQNVALVDIFRDEMYQIEFCYVPSRFCSFLIPNVTNRITCVIIRARYISRSTPIR